jgi:hypothetical protein
MIVTVASKAIGFALEQTLRDTVFTVFNFLDFRTALAYFFVNCYKFFIFFKKGIAIF